MENYWHEQHEIIYKKDKYNRRFTDILGKRAYLTAGNKIERFSNKIIISNGIPDSNLNDPPEREKQDIQYFSRHSRKRFLNLLAQINLREYKTILFVTTTFHNQLPKDYKELKNCLSKFLKRLKRIDNNLSYIWRLEFQKRGAPHFHFFLLLRKNMIKANRTNLIMKIKTHWNDLLKDRSALTWKHSVDIQNTDNKKNVFSYISKYTCKEDEIKNEKYSGRRWGYSANINLEPIETFQPETIFLKTLKKIIWKQFFKNKNMSSEFVNYFWNNNSFQFFISEEDQLKILNQTLEEVKKTNSS